MSVLSFHDARLGASEIKQLTFAAGERRIVLFPNGSGLWYGWSDRRGEWLPVEGPFDDVDADAIGGAS